MANLMDQARAQRGQQAQSQARPGGLQVPDWKQFTPPELQDDVERIVAAGSRIMYAPEMADERREAVTANVPVGESLADNVTGLLLTLDQQAAGSGGLPVAALFPALIGLLGEAVAVFEAAGKPVTQEDWEDAWSRAYVTISKKLGASDEQIMGEAQKWEGGGAPPDQAAMPGGPQGMPSPPQPGAGATTPPLDDEEAAMAEGMQ